MGNLLAEFKKIISRGNYLFHLHTNYTDGISSIYDYFYYASQKGINCLIFMEHVRKNLAYDFLRFYSDVKNVEQKFKNVKAVIGCEAKITQEGTLDIPYWILKHIRIIGIACHSFPPEIDLYTQNLIKIFKDRAFREFVRVWVHPGRFLWKIGAPNKEVILGELIKCALEEGIFIEWNLKENLPPKNILENIPFDRIIWGVDAHSVNEIDSLLSHSKGFPLST
jgi:histidinol phosphatase-like PHP family hydrolase